jgi:nicotinamide mononucleotide adenylyltransferase
MNQKNLALNQSAHVNGAHLCRAHWHKAVSTLTSMNMFLAFALVVFFSFSKIAVAADFPVAKVNFEVGKKDIPADAASQMQAVAAFLATNKDAKIEISGFTDKSGDPAQNELLAKERAKAVRDALKAAGIAEDRVAMKKPEVFTGTGNDADARRVEVNLATAVAKPRQRPLVQQLLQLPHLQALHQQLQPRHRSKARPITLGCSFQPRLYC